MELGQGFVSFLAGRGLERMGLINADAQNAAVRPRRQNVLQHLPRKQGRSFDVPHADGDAGERDRDAVFGELLQHSAKPLSNSPAPVLRQGFVDADEQDLRVVQLRCVQVHEQDGRPVPAIGQAACAERPEEGGLADARRAGEANRLAMRLLVRAGSCRAGDRLEQVLPSDEDRLDATIRMIDVTLNLPSLLIIQTHAPHYSGRILSQLR